MNKLTETLLLQIKKQEPRDNIITQVETFSFGQLQQDLTDDAAKKAGWINLYNAFFLILRKDRGMQKPGIFRKKAIRIAGHTFSLDDIEHGILRKYRYKWSLGYLPDPFAASLVKKLAVDQVDYRIHFALNCGAKSCPPIAFYQAEKIEQQLELASRSFLESETTVFPDKKEVHISRLFLWFLGDFGGKPGIRKILKEKLRLDTNGMKLVFKPYNWEEDLDNWI